MTSPLVAVNAFKQFFFSVILNDPFKQRRLIKANENDSIVATYTIYNNPNEEADVSLITAATFRIAQRPAGRNAYDGRWWGGRLHTLEKTLGAGITVSGSQIIVAVDLSELDCAGIFDYQLRITAGGKSIVLADDAIELLQLIQ